MKKVLSVVLALMLCLALTLSVSAAPNNFVSSPSGNAAPDLVEGVNEDEDCEAKLTITPYSERDTLPEDKRELMEHVYDMILDAEHIGELNDAISNLAKSKNITVDDLAVSDLFDVSYYNCPAEDHSDHGFFRIKFKADTLKNFVGLLHYNDHKWELVEGAKVEGSVYLTFKVDDLSPFAVVVNTGDGSASGGNDKPGDNQTGEPFPWALVILMAVSLVGFGVTLYFYKRKKA